MRSRVHSFTYIWIQVLKLIIRTFYLLALYSSTPASFFPWADFPEAPDLHLTIFKAIARASVPPNSKPNLGIHGNSKPNLGIHGLL